MTAIDRAKALLERTTAKEPECPCPDPTNFHEKECPWVRWIGEMPAVNNRRWDMAPDILRTLILATDSLEAEGHTGLGDWCGVFDERGTCWGAKNCDGCLALAEFEKLFPEEK